MRPLIFLLVLLLAACADSSPQPTPTNPPPTNTPLPSPTPTETPTPNTVSLQFEGAVNGQLTNALPLVEFEYVEGDDTGDGNPAHYVLRITTGEVIEQIRTIIILFRADLDPGTYPIMQSVSEVFTPETSVKASVIGAIGYTFDTIVSGELTLERVDDTFSGSFTYTGSGGQGAALTVRGEFGPLTPVETE